MMPQRPDHLQLMAYADGELDAAQAERVRALIATDPAAAAQVQAYAKLSEASRRVVEAPQPSAALIERIRASGEERADHTPLFRIGFRYAAAAVLLIAVASVVIWSTRSGPAEVIRDSALVPVAWVDSAAAVHVDCSKAPSHFAHGFPDKPEQMPDALKTFLGCAAVCPCPDLSSLGYEFAGCGPCTIPGGKTAHLLYRAAKEPHQTVSLFMQADSGQVPLQQDKAYLADKSQSPVLIWRQGGIVHYLVAKNPAELSTAARQMGMNVRI